jgi:hypothetical protein
VHYVGLIHLPDPSLNPRRPFNTAERGPTDAGYDRNIDWAFDACFKAWVFLSREHRDFEDRYRALVRRAKRRGNLPEPARFPSWTMEPTVIANAQHCPHSTGDLPGFDYSVRGAIWLCD